MQCGTATYLRTIFKVTDFQVLLTQAIKSKAWLMKRLWFIMIKDVDQIMQRCALISTSQNLIKIRGKSDSEINKIKTTVLYPQIIHFIFIVQTQLQHISIISICLLLINPAPNSGHQYSACLSLCLILSEIRLK